MKTLIPRTTLFCLDTLNHELAVRALRLSLIGCEFERAVFLTDQAINVDGVETIQVSSVADRADYSRRMLQDINDYVETDFVLIVQWDGYILNPKSWDESFLDYDYIGARWVNNDGFAVGNGGFSLRSRRLLDALKVEGALPSGNENEDEVICRRLRPQLEGEYELRFAPEGVADRFSIERIGLNAHPFGFHGLFNMASLVSDDELEWFCKRVPRGAWNSYEFFEFIVHLEAIGKAVEAKTIADWTARKLGVPASNSALDVARNLVKRYEAIRQSSLRN